MSAASVLGHRHVGRGGRGGVCGGGGPLEPRRRGMYPDCLGVVAYCYLLPFGGVRSS